MRNDISRILCVDDNNESLNLVSAALRPLQTDTATTKTEGIKKAKKGGYSLYILDYYLPDGTGEQLCNHLRTFDRETPVLFITGSNDFDECDARSIGAQGTLKKAHENFVIELRERVNDLVSRAKSTQVSKDH